MPYLRNFVLFACLAAAIGLNAPAQAPQETLPAGEGKDVVERVCTGCHGIETALEQNHTEADWKSVVDTMIGRGAEASDKDVDAIVKYLTKYFGIKN
jgi:cytochrome c5